MRHCIEAAGSHADAIIEGDVQICLGKEDSE